MKLNIPALKTLMQERFESNYHAFARALGIDVAAVHKILNKQINAGLKTINKIIDYLKTQGLNINDYIFLP